MSKIDLNCDCGESFGPWSMGNDREVLPHVTSANVACGAHAGDPNVMRQTIQLCREIGLAVGAHPGFPDLQGFGRRTLAMSLSEIENMVLAQLGALAAIAKAEGVELHHVKAHGALYNYAAANPPAAKAIAHAVATFNPQLILVGLAGSALISAGQEAGLQVAREAFADRAYEPDGSLRNRNLPGAVILNPEQNLAQAISIVRDQKAFSVSGAEVRIQADTICIHGDHSGAAERAAYLRQGLLTAGVPVAAIARGGA